MSPRLGFMPCAFRGHPHALHREEADNDARVAGYQVPATPNRHRKVVLARETNRGHHVGHFRAACDQLRTTVDHAVEDGVIGVVAVVTGAYQLAAEVRRELLDDRFIEARA